MIVPEIETVVHALDVGDFNQDGLPDGALAQMHQGNAPQEVAVYLNSGNGRNWKKHILSAKGSHNIIAFDLDNDGRLDVLGANHGSPFQSVEVWKNNCRKKSNNFELRNNWRWLSRMFSSRTFTPRS